MESSRRPLSSLDAWPGEAARPPLRLLQAPRARSDGQSGQGRTTRADTPAGWLQRLRQALLAG
jgi:hypothetical protein